MSSPMFNVYIRLLKDIIWSFGAGSHQYVRMSRFRTKSAASGSLVNEISLTKLPDAAIFVLN